MDENYVIKKAVEKDDPTIISKFLNCSIEDILGSRNDDDSDCNTLNFDKTKGLKCSGVSCPICPFYNNIDKTIEWLKKGVKDKKLTRDDLIDGMFYRVEDDCCFIIMKLISKGSDQDRVNSAYISNVYSKWRFQSISTPRLTGRKITYAVPYEIKWLKACIKQDKFVPESELNKYDDEGNLLIKRTKKVEDLKHPDVVHCNSKQERDLLYKYHRRIYDWNEDFPYILIGCGYSQKPYKEPEYTNYEFSDIIFPEDSCKKNTEFEVGKWYSFDWSAISDNNKQVVCKIRYVGDTTISMSWRKYLHDNSTSYTDGYYLNDISNIKELSLSEIQQYLPDDHEDKQFVLPEKWCVLFTKENVDILDDWREIQKNVNLNLDPRNKINDNEIAYLVSSKWDDNSYMSYSKSAPNNYTEITFEQFKRYVLNQDIEEESICETCNGEGGVMVGKLYPSGHTEVMEECADCKGSGVIERTKHKWSTGSYVVFLKDIWDYKKGDIDIITEGFESTKSIGTISLRRDPIVSPNREGNDLEWFLTLQEAEEFSKYLLGRETCNCCNGEGRVMEAKLYSTVHHEVWETCNQCNGDGYIYKEDSISELDKKDYKKSINSAEQNVSRVEKYSKYISGIDPIVWINPDNWIIDGLHTRLSGQIITANGINRTPNKYNYKYYEPEEDPTIHVLHLKRKSIKYSDL